MPGSATNAIVLEFDPCTAGSNTITHVSIGTASSGAGKILFRKQLPVSLPVAPPISPRFKVGQIDIDITGDAGNAFLSEILEHILNNEDIPLIGDASGLLQSAADGNLYLNLHTADPGAGGDQTTNEATYTGYARLAAVRDGTVWTVS
jgi:hypothetical protein